MSRKGLGERMVKKKIYRNGTWWKFNEIKGAYEDLPFGSKDLASKVEDVIAQNELMKARIMMRGRMEDDDGFPIDVRTDEVMNSMRLLEDKGYSCNWEELTCRI